MPMGYPAPMGIETEIDKAGILSIRFDGGHWLVVEHGAKVVLSVEDHGDRPRAASITYRNAWGLPKTMRVELRTPKRLG